MNASNVSGGIRNYGTLGNLVDGDCVVAAYYHILMAKNVSRQPPLKQFAYRLGFPVPTNASAIYEYATYLATLNEKPGPTQSVAIDGWLDWQQKQGKVTIWRQILPPNSQFPTTVENEDFEARVRSAMTLAGGAIVAGLLSQNAYNHWGRGTCWSYDANKPNDQPDWNLGHATAMLAYRNARDYVVTWGQWQAMTKVFREVLMNSVFVYLHTCDEQLPDYQQRYAALEAL